MVSFNRLNGNPFMASKLPFVSLNSLYPFFSKGCILAVDENTLGGETKALEEFCNKNNLDFKTGDFNGIISSYTKI